MKGGDSFSRMGEGQGEGDEESRFLICISRKVVTNVCKSDVRLSARACGLRETSAVSVHSATTAQLANSL